MVDNNSHDKFPKILIDQKNDFASIQLKNGIEKKSYLKNGIIFSEDKNGNFIEIQILNLKKFLTNKLKKAS